jgi:hypothetical protein
VIQLAHSCFIHVPKTGGTWIRRALLTTMPAARPYHVDGDYHVGYLACPRPDAFRFAFVRHPLTWYQSYWRFKVSSGWSKPNSLDLACRSNHFADFVRKVLDRQPGILSQWVRAAVGDPQVIEFVGRFERLIEDLCVALALAGENFDPVQIRAVPPVNVTNKARVAELPSALKRAILKTERDVCERFGYGP